MIVRRRTNEADRLEERRTLKFVARRGVWYRAEQADAGDGENPVTGFVLLRAQPNEF